MKKQNKSLSKDQQSRSKKSLSKVPVSKTNGARKDIYGKAG
jgi:hypothetical protein